MKGLLISWFHLLQKHIFVYCYFIEKITVEIAHLTIFNIEPIISHIRLHSRVYDTKILSILTIKLCLLRVSAQ